MHQETSTERTAAIPPASRLRAFLSCHRCLLGWTAYIAVAAIVVLIFAA